VTPYHESDGQPEWCKKLVQAGWRFRYDPATRFVIAEHPRGGRQSIAAVTRTILGDFDADEFGKQLAAMLNGEWKAAQ
jgi:hypothetical protein